MNREREKRADSEEEIKKRRLKISREKNIEMGKRMEGQGNFREAVTEMLKMQSEKE